MSWELASFLVLGAVLVAGFAWYERSRPPSQTVALVAALAALAVAGRVALAPIPNVVATTDVVLFAGYALGAAPGFAVGALAGLVSNFWLGQGPWTPWQMAGWGMTGVLGALLCAASGGRAGRLTLASACGMAAVAYGALLNFSIMASYGGELSMERFLTLQARAVPFDAAHAVGNVVLALVAGPAMIRMLARFRQRFEWRRAEPEPRRAAWRPGLSGGGVAAVVLIAGLIIAPAPAAAAADVDAAARWLASAQNRDGGFGSGPGRDSSVTMTGWTMLGLAAAGRNPLDVTRGGANPVGFLTREAEEIGSNGDLARTALALVGAGVEPRKFAGRNLLRELRARMRRDGSWRGWPNETAFAIMALRAGGAPAGLKQSLAWLREAQNPDGGWGILPGAPSDPESTGSVLQVLGEGLAQNRAVRYLRRHQRRGGGFTVGASGAVNTQATAWAVQGLIAAGVDPGSVREDGASGLDYIDASQAEDGHFRYSPSSDQTPVWVTGQVLVAAAREAYPVDAAPRRPAQSDSGEGDSASGGGESGSGEAPAPWVGDSFSGSPAAAGAPQPATAAAAPEPAGGAGRAQAGAGGRSAAGARDSGGGAADRPSRAGEPTVVDVPIGRDEAPSPLAPVGIGTGSALLALGGTWFLGRRRNW
jgi:energy-coupling factor transport system substrate-specific component